MLWSKSHQLDMGLAPRLGIPRCHRCACRSRPCHTPAPCRPAYGVGYDPAQRRTITCVGLRLHRCGMKHGAEHKHPEKYCNHNQHGFCEAVQLYNPSKIQPRTRSRLWVSQHRCPDPSQETWPFLAARGTIMFPCSRSARVRPPPNVPGSTPFRQPDYPLRPRSVNAGAGQTSSGDRSAAKATPLRRRNRCRDAPALAAVEHVVLDGRYWHFNLAKD